MKTCHFILFPLELSLAQTQFVFGITTVVSNFLLSKPKVQTKGLMSNIDILMTSWPWSLNLIKNWLGYSRLKTRLDFWRVNKKLKSSQFLKWYPLSFTSNILKGVFWESSWQADFKTNIGCLIWPSSLGENTEMPFYILNHADCIIL